ncbi:hypothetical protein EV196_11339 [Mariniflexile fucanivorans]|uniref:Uncharacterized protein n=1 Tax=Mariniflexile fucanivorans TaxID=264023 RepID=A0A4V2QD10_9FLAO|nr:hypothetical protein [Mariniflexile fucanivorans]TCL62497.1 hypothetical protein EV196_11339 [Mariniflexile fucanivorans]
MTLNEFNGLSHDEKLYTVVDKGVFLDNYVTVDIRMNLYSVDRFYVELVYDSELNQVVEVRSFKQGVFLDKYTSHIDLK